MMLTVAFFPVAILNFISGITEDVFYVQRAVSFSVIPSLRNVCAVTLLSVVLFAIIWLLRKRVLSKRTVTHAPTWGCGYTAPNPKLQYTASSFSNNLETLLSPSKNNENRMTPINENDLFPTRRKYLNEQFLPRKRFIERVLKDMNDKLAKLAVFQTGKIQHYVLFALLFMAIILILTYLNIL